MGNKKCIVRYKKGITETGQLYGLRFYAMSACCHEFARFFNSTGNSKTTDFNVNNMKARPGINFMPHFGKPIAVFLNASNGSSEINFCPFCGKEVSVELACEVRVEPEYEQKLKGYKETPVSVS